MHAGFVGRAAELDLMGRALARARTGQPSAVLVVGEPGSGKTCLVREAARRWGLGPVLRATGFEAMQPIQLAAAGELFRGLSSFSEAGPSLDSLLFGAPDSPAPDPLRVFEAAHRALSTIDPAVIVADDLQWFDERSVALLQYLLRAAAHQPRRLAVIAAARPSAAGQALADAMRGELPAERAVVVDLGPMIIEDGMQLVQAIDPGLDATTVGNLWRAAHGSPFWLEALARRQGSDATTSILEERLRTLSPDASELLAILSVAARPLSLDDVAKSPGQGRHQVRHAARELSVRGLAIEEAGGIRPAHDLIRDEVVQLLPAGVRRRIETTVATLLEAVAEGDARLLVEALEHRHTAGLPAADLARRTVTAPNSRLLGTANLRLVASISDTLPPASPEPVDLDFRIATLAAAVGAHELALERWDRAGRLSEDAEFRTRAAVGAARAAIALSRPEDARAHIATARAMSPTTADADVGLDALEAQVELWLEHRTAEGASTAERGLAAARSMAAAAGGVERLDAGRRHGYLSAIEAASDAALQQDRCHDLAALAEEAVAVARDLGEETYAAALLQSGHALRHLLRIGEAEARFRAALEMSRRLVLPTHAVEAGHGLCLCLRDLGRLAEARSVGVEAAELQDRLRTVTHHRQRTRVMLHIVDLYADDPGDAVRALRKDADEEPDPHSRIAIHQAIASWQARYLGMRVTSEVAAEVDAAIECAGRVKCPRCTAELTFASAEALARVGLTARARDLMHATPGDGIADHPHRSFGARRASALVSMAEGDTASARRLLEGLADEAERRHLALEDVWARVDLARCLTASDRARAVELLTAAALIANGTGARSQERVVSRELRDLGVRAWRRGPATVREDAFTVLSGREREVVAHLAEGRSNSEIADALQVSPKTVERHVSNVLTKLALRNRTEVAALARSSSRYGFPPMSGSTSRA